jgi:hypothetical protein
MARQDGWVQPEQAAMPIALNMAHMAKHRILAPALKNLLTISTNCEVKFTQKRVMEWIFQEPKL